MSAQVSSAHQARDRSLGDFAQMSFQLRIGFFDRVHVGTVGRQMSQLSSDGLYELLDPRSPVAGEIVHDDDALARAGEQGITPPNTRTGRR